MDNEVRTYNNGTAYAFAASFASEYGLGYKYITTSQIAGSFDGNFLVIVASIEVGMLTSSGHFII